MLRGQRIYVYMYIIDLLGCSESNFVFHIEMLLSLVSL